MRNMALRTSLAFLMMAALSVPSFGDGGRGRHKRIFVVPRPGPVKLDGKLDDWDLSGQIWIYVTLETSEMQSAKYAMMYDADALYFSGDVRDPSPMMNQHDPNVDPERAWDADVCQVFMTIDPTIGYPVNKGSFNRDSDERMCTLYMWYYTDRKEPNLAIFRAMGFDQPQNPELSKNGVIPRDKFQAAYAKAADGRGYTFEYRIPWTTLGTKHPPKAGDLLAGTACVFWSSPDGLHTAGGAAWAYDVMSSPGFPFQTSGCWGKMIFAEKGGIPKELVEEGLPPERPLPLKFEYDLPEESEVTIALVDAKGMTVRNLVVQAARRAGKVIERWDGLTQGGKVLAPGQYAWKGLYHQPIKTKFLLSVHNSGQPPYKLDNGTGGWGGDHGTPQTVCTIGDYMLISWNVSEAGWGIIRTDLKGKKQWGSIHNATHMASDGKRIFTAGDFGFTKGESVRVFSLDDSRPLNFGRGTPEVQQPPGGDEKTDSVTGLAYANGVIYASYGKRNLVALFDAESGNMKEAWQVPAPGRIAVRPDGSIAAISGDKVAAVAGGKVTPLIGDHLDAPVGITVDAAGAVYVANRGKLQNFSVFSADGKYQRSIGKLGGRPAKGRYDPSGVLEAGGVAVDKEGKLWVAETLDAPKRVSVWDTKTGQLISEFFGGSAYATWLSMDVRHEDEVYCHDVIWKVDWDKCTSQPYSTIWRATEPNMVGEPGVGGYAGHFRVMTAKNGKQFGWGMVSYGNTLYIRDGDVFKPFVSSIIVSKGNPFIYWPPYPIFEDQQKFPNGTYLWQDANNDQIIQANELTAPLTERGESTLNWIDGDLNAWCDSGFMLKPVRFEADGRPVYDFSKREPLPFRGGNSNETSLWLDPQDDTVYTLAPGGDPGFARWTRDAKLIWGFGDMPQWPEAINLPPLQPGNMWGPTMPLGTAGDYTGIATYFGPVHVVTRDGLYVTMLFKDGRLGGLGPDVIAAEAFSGQLIQLPKSKRYLLLAGDQDGRITEILGLETVKRLPGGTFTFTEADAKVAADARAEYERLKAKAQSLVIVRGKNTLGEAKAITKAVAGNRSFTVKMAYDQENLYASYEVEAAEELINAMPDPKAVFRGGNLIDIQIAADPEADPKRTKPAPGDVRVLVSRENGKAKSIVFRPRVKGFQGAPTVLTSPTGQESFDAIEVTDKVGLDYRKTAAGFQALVTVPLSLIGWTPKPGSTVRMDVGYTFGNPTGTRAALRAYWSNNSFTANVVDDIPHESRLEPKEWGTAAVE